MRKSWLLCVLLGTLAWGQAAPATPPAAQASPAPDNVAKPQAPAAPADTAAAVPPEAAVITVKGICAPQPKAAAAKGTAAKPATAAKTPPADCKTVITKAEFERLANGVAPSVTPQLKRNLAGVLPRYIAMSNEAKKRGLDKTPRFEEVVKFAKMQILSNELTRSIQQEAGKIPPEDIADYYKSNADAYAQYNIDRIFVPRTKQPEGLGKEEDAEEKAKEEKLTEDQQKAKEAEDKARQEAAQQAMTQLAESLRARAAAGEDFVKLQKEAFEAGGMKIESPVVALPKVRRSALPPAHAAVFDLKPGEVSQVISDSGGHYIYRVTSKDELTLDQVKEEIRNKLQGDRTHEMMDKVNSSFTVETNQAYFGPGGPAMPPPRGPGGPGNPRMAPPPAAPAAKPATPTPPPAEPPAAKPN